MKINDFVKLLKPYKSLDDVEGVRLALLVKNFMSHFKVSEQTAVEELNKDYCGYIVDLIFDRLPVPIRERIRAGSIAYIAVVKDNPEVYLKECEDGFVLVFGMEMSKFIYRLARIFALKLCPEGSIFSKEQFLNDLHFARLVSEVFWWFSKGGKLFGPEYEISVQQKNLASFFARDAEMFLVCHEFGHLTVSLQGSLYEEQKNNYGGLPVHFVEEYLSDLEAIKILLKPFKTAESDAHLSYILASAEFTMRIYSFLELLGWSFPNTHPSPDDRIANLRNFVKEFISDDLRYANVMSIADLVENLFYSVSEVIHDRKKFEQFVEQSSRNILSEFEIILENCAKNYPPDYSTFNRKAASLMNIGFPDLFVEKFAQKTLEYRVVLKSGIENTYIRGQYELMMAFVDSMPTSAKSMFYNVMAI